MTVEAVPVSAAFPEHEIAPPENPLSTLIALERDVRGADSTDQIAFIAVNQTRRLLDYFQCILWRVEPGGKVKVGAVSGVSDFDQHSQVVVTLQRLLKALSSNGTEAAVSPVNSADVPPELQQDWADWLPQHGLWCPFKRPGDGAVFAGLLITRKSPFTAAETELVEPLIEAYAHASNALQPTARNGGAWLRRCLSKWSVRVGALLLAACVLALPVRESALAPAEITPLQPLVVSAPVEGVIKAFHIRPNQPVFAGQLLFSMDDTDIRSQYEIAAKSYDVAKTDYFRAAQKSFSDAESKSELALFKARAEEKRLERDYAQTLFERTRVRAERDGVAVLTDVNDWIGRPVDVGQKVLTLADPEQAEVQIWLAIEDGINLEQGSKVDMFLNTDPTSPLSASVRQTSYEPEPDVDGKLAFRLKASLTPEHAAPRIGLKGTAKVYGDEVTLFYYIMRRPLSVLRQSLGF